MKIFLIAVYGIINTYLFVKKLFHKCDSWHYYNDKIKRYEIEKKTAKFNILLIKLKYEEHCDRMIQLYKETVNRIEWQIILMFVLFPLITIEEFLHEVWFWISGICAYYTIDSAFIPD